MGYFSWDYKQNGVGSSVYSEGSNDWTDSQLMMMLNPSEYLKEGYTISNNMVYDPSGNLVYSNMGSYYNRTSGYRPALMSAGATSYNTEAWDWDYSEISSTVDFSSTGLNAESRDIVQENVWYTSSSYDDSATAADYYNYERNGENPVTWRGKVGLMYLSDYYYANNNFYNNPDTYDFSTGCEDNWLCALEIPDEEWTLVQRFGGLGVYDVAFDGTHVSSYANYPFAVRPVLYLKFGVKVTGEGTIDSKYQIIS